MGILVAKRVTPKEDLMYEAMKKQKEFNPRTNS